MVKKMDVERFNLKQLNEEEVKEQYQVTIKNKFGVLRVFENRVLRRICGPKRDEVMGDWRKLHNEELHNLYSSPDIIRQVKSRRMRWLRTPVAGCCECGDQSSGSYAMELVS
jgi:hypothetical protein